MILRRIQSTGGHSFNLTLPKAWLTLKGLGRRSEVCININNDGNLIIEPKNE